MQILIITGYRRSTSRGFMPRVQSRASSSSSWFRSLSWVVTYELAPRDTFELFFSIMGKLGLRLPFMLAGSRSSLWSVKPETVRSRCSRRSCRLTRRSLVSRPVSDETRMYGSLTGELVADRKLFAERGLEIFQALSGGEDGGGGLDALIYGSLFSFFLGDDRAECREVELAPSFTSFSLADLIDGAPEAAPGTVGLGKWCHPSSCVTRPMMRLCWLRCECVLSRGDSGGEGVTGRVLSRQPLPRHQKIANTMMNAPTTLPTTAPIMTPGRFRSCRATTSGTGDGEGDGSAVSVDVLAALTDGGTQGPQKR